MAAHGACADCHGVNGRLTKLAGVYIPGRDYPSPLDWLGLAMLAMILAVVVVHGLMRVIFSLARRMRS